MRDNSHVLDRLLRRSYARLGGRYRMLFLATQIPAAALIAFVIVGVLAAYYDPPLSKVLLLAAVTAAFTAAGVAFTIVRQKRTLTAMASWRGRDAASARETIAAWDAATSYPVRSLRRNYLTANAIVVVPSAATMVVVLDLPLRAYPAVAAAGAIAAAYGSILTYSITEYFLRPPAEDLAAALPDDFQLQASGLPLRNRPASN